MGLTMSYICGNCAYKGEVSVGPNMRSLTDWHTMVCNKNKEFVSVDTKFFQKEGIDVGYPEEKLKLIEANFNKCPIHSDDDLSKIKITIFRKKVRCPKCNHIMGRASMSMSD